MIKNLNLKTQKTKISNLIIFLLTIVLVISFINGFLIEKNLKKSISNNALVVNKLGQIRGLIQRYAKNVLIDKKADYIKDEINANFKLIEDFLNKKYDIPDFDKLQKFERFFKEVKANWYELSHEKNKKKIYELSEKSWQKADQLTTFAEIIAEYKNKKLIQFISTISIVSILLIILLVITVYILIRRGLEKEKITDPLTGLFNRRYFLDVFMYYVEIYRRYKRPFSLIFLDIDNFKQINDTYGHQKGDEVLQQISEIILTSLRKTDMAFRYGGEEMVIILPETDLTHAYKFAQRLRESLKAKVFVNQIPVTASIGVGEYSGEGMFEFIKKVDACVYRAKELGKDRVVVVNKC